MPVNYTPKEALVMLDYLLCINIENGEIDVDLSELKLFTIKRLWDSYEKVPKKVSEKKKVREKA